MFWLQVVIKEERIVDPSGEYGANLPMKDYGKRKANDAVESLQQPASKKMKCEPSSAEQLSSATENRGEESKNQKKKKKKQNGPPQSTVDSSNSSGDAQQFDYGQVDFKKFKGGSHLAKRNENEVKTKFHGKVSVFRTASKVNCSLILIFPITFPEQTPR